MSRTRKLLTGIGLALLALALVAGLAITSLNQPSANAAPVAQATTTAAPGASTKTAKNPYREAFKKALAAKLGVDESKLDTAYSGAVSDVVDQAVKDGKLTQAQADKIKANAAKNGFQGAAFGNKANAKQKVEKLKGIAKTELEAAAKALNTTSDDLRTQLKAGKTIAEVAQSKNVDIKTVEKAMLDAFKAQLDTRVKDGKITQAQADKALQNATRRIDKLVNHKFDSSKARKK